MGNPSVLQVVRRVFACAFIAAALLTGVPAGAKGGKRKGRRTSTQRVGARERTPPCSGDDHSEDTRFEGSYSGTLRFPSRGLSGDATLTVTGSPPDQRFTLTASSGGPLSGRLTSVTSCKYTGVALFFGDATPPIPGLPPPPPRPAVSLRACNERGHLVLRGDAPAGHPDEFFFEAPGGASAPADWGRCYGSGRTRGNRPF